MADFDFSILPDDPVLAFIELEAHFRQTLQAGMNEPHTGEIAEKAYIDYINGTLTAAKALNLDYLDHWNDAELSVRGACI